MDYFFQFNSLRKKYPEFIYEGYNIEETKSDITLKYEFSIPHLVKFTPTINIPKKEFNVRKIEGKKIENMVFHIGLIELISYWKCTCSPKVIIKCGFLDEYQKQWLKKLYFYGLGELFFTNGIKTNINEFMTIMTEGEKFEIEEEKEETSGYIVPIGGGKDSVVTLETLKVNKQNDLCLIVNPKPVTIECAHLANMEDKQIIEVYRKIDKKLLNLNKNYFINGHTPFSSLLAFLSYFIAYITGKKYIALSNESSANESNVVRRKSKSPVFKNL